MKTTSALVSLCPLIVLIMGCSSTTSPAPAGTGSAVQPKPFKLYVCNQSLELGTIDIRVEIDGKVVVQEDFEVGRQLNWKTFDLVLTPGKHTVKASSGKGEAQLSEAFTFTDEIGASVQFWYYPESHTFATPRQFRFALLHGPMPGF